MYFPLSRRWDNKPSNKLFGVLHMCVGVSVAQRFSYQCTAVCVGLEFAHEYMSC